MNVLHFAQGDYGTGFEITCTSDQFEINDKLIFTIQNEEKTIQKEYTIDDIVSNSFVLPVIITKEESAELTKGVYNWGIKHIRLNELQETLTIDDNKYNGILIVEKGV